MNNAHDTLAAIIGGPANQTDVLVLNAASELDRLREALSWNADQLAKRLTSFAKEVRNGGAPATAPTASSLVNDIAAQTAQLRTVEDNLIGMLHTLYGHDVLKQFRDAMA